MKNKFSKMMFSVVTALALTVSTAFGATVNIEINTANYGSEISWDLTDGSGTILASDTAGSYGNYGTYTTTVTAPDGCYSMNMYDSWGDGWNGGTYSISDSATGQIYATGGLTTGAFGTDAVCWGPLGCTDPGATNYDASAIVDDGSCTYSSCTNVTLTMNDSWGDGWNGNTFVLTNSSGIAIMTSTLASGSTGVDSACIADDCYTITCGGGSYASEVSWTLTDDSGNVLASGGSPYTGGTLCLPAVFGCTDSIANNYNSSATIDDGSCTYNLGCTDPAATNYDSTATVDDGSCTYASCSNVTLNMVDSYGDGWNGNVFTMTNSAGIVVMSSTLASGLTGVDSACIADDCYTITCDGGAWQGEVSWTLIDDATGNVLASGGAPSSGITICLPAVFGCMDIFADNYDPLATINSGCLYTGCMDPNATNYCATCNVSDSTLCTYPVCNALDFSDNFEAANLAGNGWTTLTGTQSSVVLSTSNVISDTVSLVHSGGDVSWGATPATEADAFAYTDYVSSSQICIDMSGSSSIVNMTLDADLQSYFGSAYTWFRVFANGVQLADANGSAVYNNTDVNGVNTYTYDLSAFAGQSQVYIKFEASCKYGPGSGYTAWNNVVIDDINVFNVTPCTYYGVAVDYAFDASCNGGADGTASASVLNSNGTDAYSWTDASGAVVSTSAVATGLAAGTYTCTVTDSANGCSASTTATIGEPTAISASAVVVDATSPINTDGAVNLSVSGGSPCYNGTADTLDSWDGTTEYIYSAAATGTTTYFDVTASNASGINGITLRGVYGGTGNIEVWTRTGTADGNCQSSAGWTLNTSMPNTVAVNGTAVYIPLMSAIGLEAGDVVGIAIHSPTTHYFTLGGTAAFGSTHASDANLAVSTGAICANGPAFGGSAFLGSATASYDADVLLHYSGASYTYAWSNGATTQNVSGLGMGPISATITDCNGCTSTWSGFVAANVVNGCTDPNASNYDPLANTDDGSCTYPGCTDSLATNFDPNANLSDSSCTYDCAYYGWSDEINIEVFTDLYASEASWELINVSTGDTLAAVATGTYTSSATFNYTVCADAGCYIVNYYDTWGDGWVDFNGTQGYILATDANGDTLGYAAPSGASSGSYGISLGGAVCISGCTGFI